MKTTSFLADQPSSPIATAPVPQPIPPSPSPGSVIRHILLGSPADVRRTIHLLHTLRYAETTLWSPVLTIEEPLVITPVQGEAMSLLRKLL